ncbi:filamentous hemagglutinin N-terminal domain-containing protein [Calothrix sp. FACHB-1219]|uniref:two-partner secretion domain-containing protein n=1 Tax=unclassified Calothrix TaxID=2619626 RepID=UPI0016891509|nr:MULTISPECIES: filamentous hemagglutinin N-terminal domain-containing protein [unclassified Calothrix]MBD2207425.1 filamentous hemagglutinin N-terminal domain-containing protein [Calothrix sp. FACHB-168]MBD2222001.1 filamentous hemagglutinin N-terminal domain-containing protein [Calothrix sp. FACHB-1219]
MKLYLQLAVTTLLTIFIPFVANKTWAQIIPDNTLGAENSIVTPITGLSIDFIEGGAIRNQNLFHSFQEFNISETGAAYFDNPLGIRNIITRVTGNNSSQIYGILGVIGDANLFFINPQGIIFGRNATLDLQGNFIASTASSLLFDGGIEFSAVTPQASPLLSIDIPIGLKFREQPQPINVEGFGILGNVLGFGLQLQPGKTLALVGGDVNLIEGSLISRGGRLELGGISTPGTVNLNFDNSNFSIDYPTSTPKANISILDSVIDLNSNQGGSLVINANNLEYSGSLIQAAITVDNTATNNRGADLFINATGKMSMINNSLILGGIDAGARGNSGDININVGSFVATDNSFISSSIQGEGTLGNISIKALELISFDSSRIFNAVNDGAIGRGAAIKLDAENIQLNNGTRISTSIFGTGEGGEISLKANNQISVSNSFVTSGLDALEAKGEAGNIKIEANSILLNESATVSASTSGQGNAGNILLRANDLSLSDDASVVSSVDFESEGKGGNIDIESNYLLIENSAAIFANSFGKGNSGNIFIDADKDVVLKNDSFISSGIFLGLNPDGSVFIPENSKLFQGGNISIKTNTLSLTNNSSLSASTIGFANAGNILINSDNLVSLDNSEISTVASPTSQGLSEAIGNAGDITINVEKGSLSLVNGGRLQSATSTQGNAGKITTKARDSIFISNEESLIISFATPAVEGATVGRGGEMEMQTSLFSLSDGAKVISSTLGSKNSGNIFIEANNVNLNRGFLTTQTGSPTNIGNGGNAGELKINSGTLRVQNGGLISSETFNSGIGGKLTVNATDLVEVSGISPVTQRNSAITTATSGTGNAGDMQITTPRLLVENRGTISGSTLTSSGKGGTLKLNTGELTIRDSAKVTVSSQGGGDAGDIEILSFFISLDNQGAIAADTASGNGGNISLQNSDLILMDRGSEISTSAGISRASGNGGNINIDTNFLVAIPQENNDIKANSFGGRGGAININTQRVFGLEIRNELTPLSDITAFSQFSPTLNGEITLNTPDVDPSQGVVELPQTIIDPDALVAQNPCTQRAGSEFIVTGRGGLPANPSQVLSGDSNLEVNLIEPVSSSSLSGQSGDFLLVNLPFSQTSTQILPATGWIVNEKDEVILTTDNSRKSDNHSDGCAYPK